MSAKAKGNSSQTKPGRHKCDICRQSFNSLKTYLNHVRSHSRDELKAVWFECGVCKEFFPTEFDRQSHGFKEHNDVLSTVQCSTCAQEFHSNRDFYSHAQIEHRDLVRMTWIKCSKCAEFRPSKISLNVHDRNSHHKSKQEEEPPLVLERQINQIKCKFCPLIFSSAREYNEHLESCHTASKSSNNPGSSSGNLSVQTNGSKFDCEFCLHVQVFSKKVLYLEHVKNEHWKEVQHTWRLCNKCCLFYPPSWRKDHACLKLTCPVCRLQYVDDESCFDHVNKIHPDYASDSYSHKCDVCEESRPDSASLMKHKLKHLSKESNGSLTITIVASSDQEHQGKAGKIHALKCGFCGKFNHGSMHSHFLHAKKCQIQRHSMVTCLYCPDTAFKTMDFFAAHCESRHFAKVDKLICIYCGVDFVNMDVLMMHSVQCANSMSEENWTMCGYCPTIFFFQDLTRSPFYISHMNSKHRSNLQAQWSNVCSKCTYCFPSLECFEHHAKVCFYTKPSSGQKSLEIPTCTDMRKKLDIGLKSDFVSKRCPMCSKTVIGQIREHFFHAKACHIMKITNLTCSLCAAETLPTKLSYIQHMTQKHGLSGIDSMLCVTCGFTSKNFEEIAHFHQSRCGELLKEENYSECHLCGAAFFFKEVLSNSYYVSHMNKDHHDFVKSEWGASSMCEMCYLYLPPAQLAHHVQKSCIFRLLQSSNEEPPAKLVKFCVSDEKMRCGLCSLSVAGNSESLFEHCRKCMVDKMNSTLCSHCPQLSFESKEAFVDHIQGTHNPPTIEARCVFCGQVSPDLQSHQTNCFPRMSLKAFSQCEYCDMGFFFADIRNVFFFAHVNVEHAFNVEKKWTEVCTKCNFRFPNETFLKKHENVCIFQDSTTLDIKPEILEENVIEVVSAEFLMGEKMVANSDKKPTLKNDGIKNEKANKVEENGELITGDI